MSNAKLKNSNFMSLVPKDLQSSVYDLFLKALKSDYLIETIIFLNFKNN
jgi:hypothetical protein